MNDGHTEDPSDLCKTVRQTRTGRTELPSWQVPGCSHL